jgi:phosphate transport system ATP-binding protein
MIKISIQHLNLQYSDGRESLRDINLEIAANTITVIFGPSGGGKSSLLRVFNRLNDLADVKTVSGRVLLDDINILDPKIDVIKLRRRVGMVFARPVVLPMSIRSNLTYSLELTGEKDRTKIADAIVRSLKQAALWDEVKDRLGEPAVSLSGGQQQR